MKNLHTCQKTDKKGGFTIIELMVAIVVFGILTAAATVSWSSFMRYQELRGEASAFHKELLALKARAVETGDTIRVVYDADTGYTVTVDGTDEDGNKYPDNPRPVIKKVIFAKNVVFDEKRGDWNEPGFARKGSGTPEKRIKIEPGKLDAFGDGKGDCWVVIKKKGSSPSEKQFRVFKAANSVKPELQYKSGSNGIWTKI